MFTEKKAAAEAEEKARQCELQLCRNLHCRIDVHSVPHCAVEAKRLEEERIAKELAEKVAREEAYKARQAELSRLAEVRWCFELVVATLLSLTCIRLLLTGS